MKKLLIAMMSVASLAFISKAEAINSGTTFENYTGAFGADKDDRGGNDGTFWYTAGSQSDCGTLTNIDYTATYSGGRPAIAQDAPTATALAVEAEQRLERGIANYSGGFAPQDIGSGIYFDTMVQFTATDTAPTPVKNEDKLVVWLYGSAEEDGAFGIGTNLVVTAGYVTGTAQTSTPSNYIVSATGIDVQPNTWHRLTIKSIADLGDNDGVAGFVVFIDGVPMTCSDEKGDEDSAFGALNSVAAKWNNTGALFPSLVVGTLTAQQLSSVALEGTGMIDDISFTSVAPDFAKDSDYFTINWDDHVTGLAITVGGTETTLTAEQVAAKTYGIEIDGTTTVAVAPTFATDYAKDAWNVTGDATETETANTFTVTGTATATLVSKETAVRAYVTIDGETIEYSTLDAAIAAIEKLTTHDSATLKLGADYTGENLLGQKVLAEVILDLNGFTIQGQGTAGVPVIANETILTVTDTSTAKTGKIVGVNGQTAIYNNYELTVVDGKFDGAVESYVDEEPAEEDYSALLTVNGGYFTSKPTAKEVVLKQGFTWTATPDENGYYTLTEGEGPDPEPTYTVTVTAGEGTTVTGAPTAAVESGTEVTLNVALTDGYKNLVVTVAGATVELVDGKVTFVVTADTTVEASATQMVTYTVTIAETLGDNVSSIIANPTSIREDAASKMVTLVATFAEGYELDHYTVDGVEIEGDEFEISANVVVNAVAKKTGGDKEYPAYINEADKAKYDAWVEANKVTDRKDTEAALQAAYLLNVAPADAEAEAAKFAITAITVGDGVVVTVPSQNSVDKAFNGTVEIKGKAALTDADWATVDYTTHHFFKAFLK